MIDKELPAGVHVVKYDLSGLPAGIYLVRLTAGKESAIEKIIKLR